MSDARKRAGEAIRNFCAFCGTSTGERRYGDNSPCGGCGLRPFFDAEPAPACGSVSTVRSDDPPAKPLPTCCNCGSNFIEPAPASDAVAPEMIIDTVRWVLNDAHYKAPEQIAGLWREVWAPKLRTAIDAMPVGAPAADAVAEAADAAQDDLCHALWHIEEGSRDEAAKRVREVQAALLAALDARRLG